MEDWYKHISDKRIIFGYKKRYTYPVNAVIKEVKTKQRGESTLYAAVYEYYFEGHTYCGEGEFFYDKIQTGDHEEIFIDPNNPADFNGKHRKLDIKCEAEIIYSIVFIIFTIFFFIYSIKIKLYKLSIGTAITVLFFIFYIVKNIKKMHKNRYIHKN